MNTNPRFTVPDPDRNRTAGPQAVKPFLVTADLDSGPLKELAGRLAKTTRVDLDPEDLQRVVERLLKAGWITKAVVCDAPDSAGFQFTSLGQKRMRQIAEGLRPLAPHLFGGAKRKKSFLNWIRFKLWRGFRFELRFPFIAAELFPPRLSVGERETLFGLVVLHANIGPKD